MDDGLRHTIEGIHRAPYRGVLAAAGAGGEAIAWLLRVPGASGTVVEAIIPYAPAAMAEFLGEVPARFVSSATARAMAARACHRARHFGTDEASAFGLGCTGALATLRPKRGAHRVYLAVRRGEQTATYSLHLEKGARTREEEEEVCSRLAVHALALACQVLPAFVVPLRPGEDVRAEGGLSPARDLLEGRTEQVRVDPAGEVHAGAPWSGGILSGAFNPLHDGHRQLARVAAGLLGEPVAFELSLRNVDKPPLSEWETLRRARQFSRWATLLLTAAPTFREKARRFPGCAFVIGYDTMVRVVAPRYYAGEEDVRAALAEIREQGCRFLVAGREYEGTYHTLSDVAVPPEFRDLFQAIPEAAFRLDISSTALREAAR